MMLMGDVMLEFWFLVDGYDLGWINFGVPYKCCTLFSLSKVFPNGFSLERFLRRRAYLDCSAPCCRGGSS